MPKKHGAVQLTVDLSASGGFTYDYYVVGPLNILTSDADSYYDSNGKKVQKFKKSQRDGGKWRLWIIASNPLSLPDADPTITLTFTDGVTPGATPLSTPVPATLPYHPLLGWFYDFDFTKPPPFAVYKWTLTANFTVGGSPRTYLIDPEMDCSDTGVDPNSGRSGDYEKK